MTDDRESTDSSHQRSKVLSTWENEGGAQAPQAPQPTSIPELTNTELVQLRIRVIALENLLISVLSHASDQELDTAERMASCIRPRSGSTVHPLTVSAADHMNNIVKRALHLRMLPEPQDTRG